MTALSGKFGVVDGQSTVRNWSIEDNQELQQYVASNTKLGNGAVPGVTSWEGSFAQYGVRPTVLPGTFFAFSGYTAPDDGISGNGMIYSGQALLSQAVLNWNWAGGEILNSELTFMGHLTLTAAAAAQLTDATIPDPPTVCGTKIEYSTDGVAWNDLEHLVSATLTLEVEVLDYVNSSTACETGRQSGPQNWNLSIVREATERPLVKGQQYQFRIYDNATEFWLLKWGMVQDYTGITVDRETGAIIQQTSEILMSVSDGTELGEVTVPGGGTKWYDGAA